MTRADSCRVGAVVLALVATVLVAAGVGGPVKAAFPGHNGKIIFASSRSTGPGVDNPSGDYEIFSMNPDGTGLTQLTNNGFGVDDFAPAFSADGAKITYSNSGAQTSNPEGDPEIYVMAADGSNPTNLTNNGGGVRDSDPTFSPDGTKIAFTSGGPQTSSPEGDNEIYVMAADGSNLTNLTNNNGSAPVTDPDWQPSNSSSPAATDDSYTTNENQLLNEAAAGVLANDTDPENDPLTAVKVSEPANGQLSLSPDGSFTYTPNAGFSGSDSFTYKANDGTSDSNTATVTITVNAVNHAPVAVDDSATTDEDTAAVIDVLSNDSDADGDSLSVVGSSLGTPAHGKVELITTSGTDKGKVLYTPRADYNGPDSFKYRASDGSAQSNVATVNFTVGAVNDAPVAQDDSYNVNENTQLQVSTPGVVGNDSDADGDSLTAVQVTGPANGQLTLNTNGSFTYTPDANFSGTDSFTYKANDGSADSNTATVTITVNHVDTTAPTVVSVEPPDKQTGVSTKTNITITFSEKMDPSALNAKTVTLVKPGKKPTSIPVTMTNKTGSSGRTVLTLDPYGATTQKLAGNTTYQLTIEGAGDTDGLAVRDSVGNELAKDYVSSFTTARK